jgi:ABC-2 type transport system permease protein
MELLLAQPVSRKQVIGTHTAVTLIGVLLLSIIAYAGTHTGISTTMVTEMSKPVEVPLLGIQIPFTGGKPMEVPMIEKVAPESFLSAAVNYFALGTFLVGFTTFMSSWDRYRWRTIGITVGFYVISTILELVGLAVDGFQWVKCVTFFAAYEPIRFVSEAVIHPEREWVWIVRDGSGVFQALGPLSYDLILAGLGLLGMLAGVVIFCRRDLPAPV